ncbi:dsRBD fold-containing protein [Kitasatospora sp. LaBMicrA B282]|uniref:dsRBD fold-containing protein n=1 Tax=Kitasatospora sp. LaBMicrA B282 TaxID=3420949 RepID=UPI003D0FFF4A
MRNYRLDNQWDVELGFEEDGTTTLCQARLIGDRAPAVLGRGEAQRSAVDRPAPRIGEELAAARALTALARQLRAQADGEIGEVNRNPAYPDY